MPLSLRNVSLGLGEPEEELLRVVGRRLGVPVKAIRHWAIVRRSIDARKQDIHFSYQVEVSLDGGPTSERACMRRSRRGEVSLLKPAGDPPVRCGNRPLAYRPIVVGFGPGGMFAALQLAERGYQPLVLERGREVRRRHRDVMQRFYRERIFDPTSNLLFGEGGAGTYSDGKLYTRLNSPLCRRVLECFYQHGADPDVLIDTRPHIGSDKLPTICTRIRKRIESLGGEILFETSLEDIRVVDGRLAAIRIRRQGPSQLEEWIDAGPVIFAIGHSARDTIQMLWQRGVRIEAKPFQIGVRIEHPQAMVDRWQYGAAAGHGRLGAAEYHVVAKDAAREFGDVFSFCMCPGGMILPTNESAGLVVTNGASQSHRSGPFANSGLVFTLEPTVLGFSALDGLDYQRKWERLAFAATGNSYRVPAQRACDFLQQRLSEGTVETSYPLGAQFVDIRTVIPDSVSQALQRALPMLERKFPGFAGPEALLTAPETRASAPIRMVRDKETREAQGVAGFYPVGEGAGYAGGIISAAVDGIKSAHAVIETYAPPR